MKLSPNQKRSTYKSEKSTNRGLSEYIDPLLSSRSWQACTLFKMIIDCPKMRKWITSPVSASQLIFTPFTWNIPYFSPHCLKVSFRPSTGIWWAFPMNGRGFGPGGKWGWRDRKRCCNAYIKPKTKVRTIAPCSREICEARRNKKGMSSDSKEEGFN